MTKTVLPIIQSLWIGNPLSSLEKLCIQSFLDHGHEFHLYTYTDIGGIPDGTVIKDGNEILSKECLAAVGNKQYETFSDWFRYALLAKHGGWWVDMDTICIKPFDFTEEIVFGLTEGLRVQNAQICFPKGHFLPIALEKACREHTAPQVWDDINDVAVKKRVRRYKQGKDKLPRVFWGPDFLTKAVYHYDLQKHGKPFQYFHAAGHSNYEYWFDNSFSDGLDFYQNTYGIHLYHSMLSRLGIDKHANFPEGSVLEQLKQKHGITSPSNAQTLTHDELRTFFYAHAVSTSAKRQEKMGGYRNRWKIVFLCGVTFGLLIGIIV